MTIEVQEVSKRFVRNRREVLAIEDLSLTVDEGEFIALVGPSGCGKSTLLNMIAGILDCTGGRILHDGQEVRGVNSRVGYMTQADSLLPWRSAEANIWLPLEIRHARRAERMARAAALLEMVNLKGFGSHFPNELSGGMRKRVALAQVLAYDPGTLLMDEPFGALDAQLKLVMQDELLKIWERTRKTVVFVTHDLAEAIALADRVVVFTGRPGRIKMIEQIDLPRPRDVFRVRFQAQFQQLYERLWQGLEAEIRKGESL